MEQKTMLSKILKPMETIIFLFFLLLSNCKGPSTIDTHPIIWISTFELSFTASEIGPNPSPQVLKIKNSGIEALTYSITDDANWLTVTPANGSSSGQIQDHAIAIDKAGLTGRDEPYSATIKITSLDACNSPQEVTVSLKLTKEPPPEISLSPKDLSFAASTSGPNPSSQSIKVKNSSMQTLSYTISDDAAWLDVTPASGTSTGQENTHAVSVNASGLTKGTYTGKITVSDPNATNSPQIVNVALEVSEEPPPQISVTPNELSFSATIGGGDPSPKIIRIRNNGKRTLNYVVTDDAPWLDVSPQSGSSTGQENAHTVAARISGLTKGTYSATIAISDPAATNSPQTVRVSLSVTELPPPPPPPANNEIAVSCDPGSGETGTEVTVTIWISGNTAQIKAFGLELSFDSTMFDYRGTSAGNLVGGWSFGDNLVRAGVVKIGGFGGTSSISVGSSGSIAVVRLRVTGSGSPNGKQTQISIGGFTDDIVGMKTNPSTVVFTFTK